MNYEDMSDLQINRLVAEKMGGYAGDCGEWLKDGVKVKDPEIEFLHTERTYCSSPSDAWPIIVESGISIQPTGDSWISGSSVLGTQFIDKNPLRAAMICFLKMKDAEK